MRARLAIPSSLFLFSTLMVAQNDAAYTQKIKDFTTDPVFLTELVDHLPASAKVPTPDKILGFIPGEPGKLAKVDQMHRYLRELEKASPRVKGWNIGASEEGRDTMLVAISSEKNLARLGRLKEITAKLADPRKLTEADAQKLIAEGLPIYWATGSIHSTEMGSPTMLMEMAYRLAVEETPVIQTIRDNMVVLITPATEVDGWDRQVDLQAWRRENPSRQAPSLLYWGKYVAHDNNRDGMALSLNLSRIVVKTFLDWHPTVLHDLHESVPYLYVSTGMGPYNAWVDPIVVNEWQKLAYHEVEEMTKRGVPGVWTHGFYDGWALNYMFWTANTHNAIGRFYETFGNGGADTRDRTLTAAQTSRAWYRPNPPLDKVKWSYRNNINLQQSALLLAMNYTARNGKEFLNNFYLKGKRSIEKATKEGPAAWVIPADDPRPAAAAELVNLMAAHGVETHLLDKAVEVKGAKLAKGSYVLRMDQPYSRLVDMMFDKQFYNAADTRPYDDTGWSVGPLRNVATVRVTDAAILKEPMTILGSTARAPGGVVGNGPIYAAQHNADNVLATFRYSLKDVPMLAAEKAFEAGGRKFNAGTFLIPADNDLRTRLNQTGRDLGVQLIALDAKPEVPTHKLTAARVALVHTWLSTQTEGWFRIALDKQGIPYDYVSTQVLAQTPDLKAKWDVIILGPTPGASQRIVNGLPKNGPDPVPFKKSELTPSFGLAPDQADDIRGGMGLEGLLHIQKFVEQGGVFAFIAGNSSIPIDYGLVEGITISATRELNAKGSVLQSRFADRGSPLSYGYEEKLSIYFNQAPVFQVSANGGLQLGGGGAFGNAPQGRPTGRGGVNDPDEVQARAAVPAPPPPAPVKPGEDAPVSDELREFARPYLAPENLRPRTILRFAEERELLVSGMLAGGRELAGRPALLDVPKGKGHYLLFANNPMWRHETQGSFFLLFNAMLNAEDLHVGRAARGGGRAD
ncbi:MAG: M14 family zinc carboxypeptidase [Acidobacteria bacterium]|nr:M14 family zinc carboxypeptidase [Acidobacteriota bacterium]